MKSFSVERRTRGATLIEAITAIVVLGIALPPLAALFREVAAQEPSRVQRIVGIELADSLMEEIVSKYFESPNAAPGSFGFEAGSTYYDDIDDFDGLDNSPPERLNGVDLDDYKDYRRRSFVENVATDDPDAAIPEPDGSTRLKRIRVRVNWDGGEVELTTLRTAPLEIGGLIDEDRSSAWITDDNRRRLDIPLISISNSDLVLESISMTSVPTWWSIFHPGLEEIELGGETIARHDPVAQPMPLDEHPINQVPPDERTIAARGHPLLELTFAFDTPDFFSAYSLTLHFVGGEQSTLTFSVDW